MTSYILEDYFQEIGRLKTIKMKGFIVPVIGYFIKDKTLMIFQEEYFSLYDLLYSPEREDMRRTMLDAKEKYSICT